MKELSFRRRNPFKMIFITVVITTIVVLSFVYLIKQDTEDDLNLELFEETTQIDDFSAFFGSAGEVSVSTDDVSEETIKSLDVPENWQFHENSRRGYKLRYPNNWHWQEFAGSNATGDIAHSGFGHIEFEEQYQWAVITYNASSKTPQGLLEAIGNDFNEDRVQTTENILINEIEAIKAITTSNINNNFYNVTVIVEKDNKLFFLSNGGIKDNRFDLFINSFEFIE